MPFVRIKGFQDHYAVGQFWFPVPREKRLFFRPLTIGEVVEISDEQWKYCLDLDENPLEQCKGPATRPLLYGAEFEVLTSDPSLNVSESAAKTAIAEREKAQETARIVQAGDNAPTAVKKK